MSHSLEINLDYLHACRLLFPNADKMDLVLVGCGGTGSWLAPSIVRVARLMKEQFGKLVNILFVDPDVVEAKNCFRQNFCEAEIGLGKADALAWRYGLVWGVEIAAIKEKLEASKITLFGQQSILIGCVDNAEARQFIKKAAVSYRAWWLDCGNHQSAGQVLLGSGMRLTGNPFQLTGFCSWLPLPSDQHPELLEEVVTETIQEENQIGRAHV